MAFLSTTASFTRYTAEIVRSDSFWNHTADQVETMMFREGGSGVEEESYGWCPFHDPYSATITLSDVSFGEFFLAGIRIEQRRVPSAVIKKFCIIEEKRVMEEKGMKRLPARLRKEIRERVRLELLAKSIPVPKIVELLWDTSVGHVFLFSCQDRVREVAEDLFYRTFDIRLQPVLPYTLAEEYAASHGLEESLKSIRAEAFV